jgi:hypothetical protein
MPHKKKTTFTLTCVVSSLDTVSFSLSSETADGYELETCTTVRRTSIFVSRDDLIALADAIYESLNAAPLVKNEGEQPIVGERLTVECALSGDDCISYLPESDSHFRSLVFHHKGATDRQIDEIDTSVILTDATAEKLARVLLRDNRK